jgi:ubiquinone/menaquinone biosynthesis C-methylase UbiE
MSAANRATISAGAMAFDRVANSYDELFSHTASVGLQCPECAARLPAMAYHSLGQPHAGIECRACSNALVQEQGIWLALSKPRRNYFRRFILDYEIVRKAEGRGSDQADFYLSLPYGDRTGRNSWQWAIRARTYKYIEEKLLPGIQGSTQRSLKVLDLGAGNTWLSYRLANLGHRPIAIDLQTNAYDGLGAAVHYLNSLATPFPRFQAELDRLPFGDRQFDCAIFNASFHYSENYDATLAEAIRCLQPGGTIVIADTPSYSREESGQQMLEERRRMFQKQFGFASDSLASREYLTRERLTALEAKHGVEWTTHKVWYGLRWAVRPLVAKLKRRREPSQFLIYAGKAKTA